MTHYSTRALGVCAGAASRWGMQVWYCRVSPELAARVTWWIIPGTLDLNA